ncbi:uncharacterized protein LOC119163244 isoform X2 [Rhipicephalus microplus]|uniref:uncharacterized protein LOC119163244 isoform X2 n=1 Tax=Rhipicephalus microplus TaxID=6941 RepID=UPI003F6D4AEE
MLACEHRLRPRPFLGVLPRNCTSYSRDRACSTILDDGDPGSRPTSAPGRCRTMSNSTQWASAAEANPQPQPESEQQQQKQQQQAPECRGEPTPPATAESPTAAPTGVDDLQQPPLTAPLPALAEPEAEVTREPMTTEAESTRPDASVRLQPPPSAASAESAHAQSSSKKPSPASSVASAAATTAVVVPDTKCEVERRLPLMELSVCCAHSPSWAGPSHVGVSVFEPPGGGDSGRVCGNLQNNNNGGSPPQETSGTTPARDKQSKTCCFCWCCCCSCSCLALKSNNGNVRSPRDNNQRLTTGDSIFNGDGEPPPTLEEIRTWGDSFEKLMKCSAGRKVFRDFLKCEYSEENILFWLACEDLKKESNPELIEEKARAIYEDYISILSPKEVSLDSRVREIINRNMVEPTPHTFDEAQLQIYTLMHRDSYPRFVNSPLFRKLAQLPSPSRKGSAA